MIKLFTFQRSLRLTSRINLSSCSRLAVAGSRSSRRLSLVDCFAHFVKLNNQSNTLKCACHMWQGFRQNVSSIGLRENLTAIVWKRVIFNLAESIMADWNVYISWARENTLNKVIASLYEWRVASVYECCVRECNVIYDEDSAASGNQRNMRTSRIENSRKKLREGIEDRGTAIMVRY